MIQMQLYFALTYSLLIHACRKNPFDLVLSSVERANTLTTTFGQQKPTNIYLKSWNSQALKKKEENFCPKISFGHRKMNSFLWVWL